MNIQIIIHIVQSFISIVIARLSWGLSDHFIKLFILFIGIRLSYFWLVLVFLNSHIVIFLHLRLIGFWIYFFSSHWLLILFLNRHVVIILLWRLIRFWIYIHGLHRFHNLFISSFCINFSAKSSIIMWTSAIKRTTSVRIIWQLDSKSLFYSKIVNFL